MKYCNVLILSLLTFSMAQPSSASELTPLRIVSKELGPVEGSSFRSKASGEEIGPHTMRLTLRNHSGKVITAFHISGILDTGRGDYSLWEDTRDGYEAFIFGVPLSLDESIVPPGDALILDVPDNRQPGLGFYSAQGVRVDAVIFDDMTAAGDPKAVGQLLRARQGKIRKLLDTAVAVEQSLDSASAEMDKSQGHSSLEEARRTNWLFSWVARQAQRENSPIEAVMRWRDRLQEDVIVLEGLLLNGNAADTE